MQQFLVYLLYTLLAITSLFLICLVLIQRGKGGGLAGAFGGAGGSSAFGTKAGDVFTRVTMISAGIWISLNMLLVVVSNNRASAWGSNQGNAAKTNFKPATKLDLDKVGKPGSSAEIVPALPQPKATSPAPSPNNTAVPAAKGTPDTTLLLPKGPSSSPATAPAPAPPAATKP